MNWSSVMKNLSAMLEQLSPSATMYQVTQFDGCPLKVGAVGCGLVLETGELIVVVELPGSAGPAMQYEYPA